MYHPTASTDPMNGNADIQQQYFSVSQTPTAIVYLDGEQKAKVEGMDPAKMQEVAAMLEKGA